MESSVVAKLNAEIDTLNARLNRMAEVLYERNLIIDGLNQQKYALQERLAAAPPTLAQIREVFLAELAVARFDEMRIDAVT